MMISIIAKGLSLPRQRAKCRLVPEIMPKAASSPTDLDDFHTTLDMMQMDLIFPTNRSTRVDCIFACFANHLSHLTVKAVNR